MSDTNELEALLRRWADLEPWRCRVNPRHFELSVQRGGIWRVVLDVHGTALHRLNDALQEAIEAKFWRCDVESSRGYAVSIHGGREHAGRCLATTTLAAYINALESTPQPT